MNDAEKIKKYMETLGCTEQEAKDIIAYDLEVDHETKDLPYDLTKEQEKVAREMRRTGTRKATPKGKMKETGLHLDKRPRKADTTKEGIIAKIAEFLAKNEDLGVNNCEIVNKQGEISFEMGGEVYSLKLTRHRKPKT